MALGRHYGSFAKGFTDSLLAMMKLQLAQENAKYNNQFLQARANYYNWLASGGKSRGINNPELQREIDKGYWGWGSGTGAGSGSTGSGPASNASDLEKFKCSRPAREGAAITARWPQLEARQGRLGPIGSCSPSGTVVAVLCHQPRAS